MKTASPLSHETPSLPAAIVFSAKSAAHKTKRGIKNFREKVNAFPKGPAPEGANVLAESVSDLWSNDNEQNKMLTVGKIQNLRMAAQQLNGVVVPGGGLFSFWAHAGRPSRMNGFVEGRELREGCIIPTTGGGLCQLSNALYDAALTAGFEIVERHRHSKVIPGSLAEKDRDATVFWNYVDLRFRSKAPFRIEIEMTETKLTVRFRGKQNLRSQFRKETVMQQTHTINDCLSCGVTSCFRSVNNAPKVSTTTAWLLDEKWAEYDQFLKENAAPGDTLLIPVDGKRFDISNYGWTIPAGVKFKTAPFTTIFRSLNMRRSPKQGRFLQRALLSGDEQLAKACSRSIPYKAGHLVIAQNLLPFLHQNFMTAGRTYDVLMTRLPLFALQQRLDEAAALHPNSKTLGDFRADENFVQLEKLALQRARKIITPHPEIAALYPGKAVLLDWKRPMPYVMRRTDEQILFAASALGRKGAYEMKEAARRLGLSLRVLGRATEYEGFWGAVNVQPFDGDWNKIGLVVLPAFVEHQPRLLLKALSLGIPVIASSACGVQGLPNVTTIKAGNAEELIEALRMHTGKIELKKAV